MSPICPPHPLSELLDLSANGHLVEWCPICGAISDSRIMPLTIESPRLHVASPPLPWTREQWLLVKQLADQAWDEYDRRFPR